MEKKHGQIKQGMRDIILWGRNMAKENFIGLMVQVM